MKTTNFRIEWLWAVLVLAAAAFGFFGTGCAAHAPAPQVEAVGTLAAGPSVYSAPVHESTPPPSETYAVRARRERQTAPVSAAVQAPDVAPKSDGLILGEVR